MLITPKNLLDDLLEKAKRLEEAEKKIKDIDQYRGNLKVRFSEFIPSTAMGAFLLIKIISLVLSSSTNLDLAIS